MEIVLIVVIILLLFGYGSRRSSLQWGYYGDGFGLIMIIILVYLAFRVLGPRLR